MTFYIKEAYRNLKFAGITSVITFISLLLASNFIVASYLFTNFSSALQDNLKKNVTASFYLEDSLSESAINALISEIGKESTVKKVDFLSKDEARKEFIRQTGEDFSKILSVNPLPASLIVAFDSQTNEISGLGKISESIARKQGITGFEFRAGMLEEVMAFTKRIRLITITVSAVFLFIALYLAYTSIRSAFAARSEDFNTMRLVGGSLMKIKLPAYISTLSLGIMCAFITYLFHGIVVNSGLEFLEINISNSSDTVGVMLSWVSAPLIAFLGTFLAAFSIKIELRN